VGLYRLDFLTGIPGMRTYFRKKGGKIGRNDYQAACRRCTMNEPHPLRWKSMISLGLLTFLIGMILLFFPGFVTALFSVFAGIAIIMLAGILFAESLFIDREGLSRWGVLVLGIIGILFGLIVIAVPALLVIAAGIAFGLFLFIFGIIEAVVSYIIIEDLMVRLVIGFMGFFAVLLGTVIILHPEAGIDTVSLLAGLYLAVFGMMRIAHGLNERHAEQNITIKRL
jgi:uncharacterized membrane protein HdeD (DUF308 family)